jgi:hypothetical protein
MILGGTSVTGTGLEVDVFGIQMRVPEGDCSEVDEVGQGWPGGSGGGVFAEREAVHVHGLRDLKGLRIR